MTDHIPEEVDASGRDLRAYADSLRLRSPIVRNVQGEWVLLGHDLVAHAALDPDRFSSAVSRHLLIPNGLDGEEHAAYRAALDPFLTEAAIAPHLDAFARIADDVVAGLPRGAGVEAVSQIGAPFAVRAQSAWLGWPSRLEGPLIAWVAENHAATRSGDTAWMERVAEQFDALIGSLLDERRDADPRTPSQGDVTTLLLHTNVAGRLLTDPEIVSVLRNWTGGDLGSLALCTGVIVHHLVADPALQRRLREGVSDSDLDAVIDEMLRIDDPFVSNRRVTTGPVVIGGVALPAGARVKLNWTSANRDESVFGDPDAFRPAHNAADNLVYGLGKHACPGRLLATVELRTLLRRLLDGTRSIDADPERPAHRELPPVGGWAVVPIVLR